MLDMNPTSSEAPSPRSPQPKPSMAGLPCGQILRVRANNDLAAVQLAMRIPTVSPGRLEFPEGWRGAVAVGMWYNVWHETTENPIAYANPGDWVVWVRPEKYPECLRIVKNEDFIEWFRLCFEEDDDVVEKSVFDERVDLKRVVLDSIYQKVEEDVFASALGGGESGRPRECELPLDNRDQEWYAGVMTYTTREIPTDANGNDVFTIERRDGSGVRAKAIRVSVATSDFRMREVLGKRILFERGDGGIFQVFIKGFGEAIDILPGSWLVRYVGTNEADVIDLSVLANFWEVVA